MENRDASKITLLVISLSVVLMIGALLPGSGYSQFQPGQKRIVGDGQELSVKGVILNRDGDTVVLRDISRTDTVVALTDSTKIRTERQGLGIIRKQKPFDVTVLVPPLRRITIPMGYGETQSEAKTAQERAQERRVEVRILVNKGLSQSQ